jgi:plasmid maintenance system antidote protein VapI
VTWLRRQPRPCVSEAGALQRFDIQRDAIEQRIREEGWTQTEAAARLHVTQPRVSDLLTERSASSALTRWSTYFHQGQTRPRESLNQVNVEQAQSAQQALINESNLDADTVDEKSLIGGQFA